ncbi:MAG TPA: amidohydrolase family protein, partial [Candidatus Obscuribacterales bacterium]
MLRRLGELLSVKGEQAILERRARLDEREYVRMLWDEAQIGSLIIDNGFGGDKMLPIPQLEDLCGRPVFECRRIETVLEDCITITDSFSSLSKEFAWRLMAETPLQPVALKTIMAYRGGLKLDTVTSAQAESDYASVKAEFAAGKTRIVRRPLYHYFLMQAFELATCHSLPVQVHTGLGDDDQDLVDANPALLQPLFRLDTLKHTKWILLHCYPYVREASLMCALYGNVFMDLSLALTLVSPVADNLIVEAISCAPHTKLLTATDGHSVPETHWYGATIWKESMKRLQIAPVGAGPLFANLQKAL